MIKLHGTITVPYEHWWENETLVIVITNSNYLLTTSIITIFEEGSTILIYYLPKRSHNIISRWRYGHHYIMGYNFQKGKTNKEGKLYKVITYIILIIFYTLLRRDLNVWMTGWIAYNSTVMLVTWLRYVWTGFIQFYWWSLVRASELRANLVIILRIQDKFGISAQQRDFLNDYTASSRIYI